MRRVTTLTLRSAASGSNLLLTHQQPSFTGRGSDFSPIHPSKEAAIKAGMVRGGAGAQKAHQPPTEQGEEEAQQSSGSGLLDLMNDDQMSPEEDNMFSGGGRGGLPVDASLIGGEESAQPSSRRPQSKYKAQAEHIRRHMKVNLDRDKSKKRQLQEFSRDKFYSSVRPKVKLPWLSENAPTYIDQAERRFGKKEHWHKIEDPALRRKLCALLVKYVEETSLMARQLFAVDIRKGEQMCRQRGDELVGGMVGLLHRNPEPMDTLVATIKERQQKAANREGGHEVSAQEAGSPATDVSEGLSEEELAQQLQSPDLAYPFLRSRIQQETASAGGGGDEGLSSSSIDPQLVEWTKANYPNDTLDTFKPPKELDEHLDRLREEQELKNGNGGGSITDLFNNEPSFMDQVHSNKKSAAPLGSTGGGKGEGDSLGIFAAMEQFEQKQHAPSSSSPPAGKDGQFHAAHGLPPQRETSQPKKERRGPSAATIRYARKGGVHDPRRRSLNRVLSDVSGSKFDESGILVKKQRHQAHERQSYVKVDWDTVRTAKGSTKTNPAVHKARERMTRLKRGEDPEALVNMMPN